MWARGRPPAAGGRSRAPLVASEPAGRARATAARCRRAGWARATGQPASARAPPTAIWPPKSTIHGRPAGAAAVNRRRASPLPKAPASRAASAARVTRQVSASNRKCVKPVAARAARRASGAGAAPPVRSPQASTSLPTAGSNAPSVRRCQRASRGHRPHSAGGSENGSSTGWRLRALRTLSARHVLSAASVRSIRPTIRSSRSSPAGRSAACTTRVAQVPIRWTVRSTGTRAAAGCRRAPCAPPATIGAVPAAARPAATTNPAALMGKDARRDEARRRRGPTRARAASRRPRASYRRRRRRRWRPRGPRSTR